MAHVEWQAVYNFAKCVYEPQKCAWLIPSDFQHLQAEIAKHNLLFIDEKALIKAFKTMPSTVRTKEHLFQYLIALPLQQFLISKPNLNEFFLCYFYEECYAWISHNQHFHYRYFSKGAGEKATAFDLLDLLSLQYNVPLQRLFSFLKSRFSLMLSSLSWREAQYSKYEENESFSFEAYPYLHNALHKMRPFYNQLNQFATKFVTGTNHAQGEHLFFASSEQLSKLFAVSSSKANKCINYLAVLGLIEKIPIEHVPLQLRQTSLTLKEKNQKQSVINYYSIPRISTIAEKAEEVAKCLNEHKVRYSNLSKVTVANLFGELTASKIYPQTIQKNKRASHKQRDAVAYRLGRYFSELLDQRGYVTKAMLLEKAISQQESPKIKHMIQLAWNDLLKKYGCIYIKPTKEMKQTMQLQSSEYIAMKGD